MKHQSLFTDQVWPGAKKQRQEFPMSTRLFVPLFITFGMLLLAFLYQPNTASAAAPLEPTGPGGTVPSPSPLIFLSAGHSGEAHTKAGKIHYRDEDIVAYAVETKQLGIYFDGSAHGLGPVDLEDFELRDDGSIYFTINKPFTIPNPHGSPTELRVDDSDVVQYNPTTDNFSIFLRGTDVGLTHGSEDIDALAFAPDGRLLISTIGSAKVNGVNGEVKAKDEDLLACDPVSKICELYFDGSDLGLTRSKEDLMAVWVRPNGGNELYMTTKGRFKATASASEAKGNRDNIFQCTPLALGDTTDCTLAQFFDAEEIDWDNQIDGLAINFNASLSPSLSASTLDTTNESEDDAALTGEDYDEAMSQNDEEIDSSDFIDVAHELFLPAMTR